MKKLYMLFATIGVFTAMCALPACGSSVNYNNYVSEMRSDIFIYGDDVTEIKIYCSEKEQPYAADGIKGNLCGLIEIFVSLAKNPDTLEASVNGLGGEMNYRTAENDFYLSFSAKAFETESVTLSLDADGKSTDYVLHSVRTPAVLTCGQALDCAVEHDGGLFESLTQNNLFAGEIFVRLIYDGACYYYVGVCDRQKTIHAFLIDGERGKIIAVKTIHV